MVEEDEVGVKFFVSSGAGSRMQLGCNHAKYLRRRTPHTQSHVRLVKSIILLRTSGTFEGIILACSKVKGGGLGEMMEHWLVEVKRIATLRLSARLHMVR